MRQRILLINPPIYDFSAYDFWLKPYGLLRVAGQLRDQADLELFDFLDRAHPCLDKFQLRSDSWGRGKFLAEETKKPKVFSNISRSYRRYGLPELVFRDFISSSGPFDAALIQTNMTYWYPGISEVLKIIRELTPGTRTVLGGIYATICPDHARTLGADLVVEGCSLESLWDFLDLQPDENQPPFWEGYDTNSVGVLKLAEGCPFRCTYCSVPKIAPKFQPYVANIPWDAYQFLKKLGTKNLVFYDDALLFRFEEVLAPFLKRVVEEKFEGSFHTPNALNARFLSPEAASLAVRAGFRFFYLGFESSSQSWQRTTGGKVSSGELQQAVAHLIEAGANPRQITAYMIVGHPETEDQEIERSMKLVHSLGIRIMLSEFSPIPGTPDGEKCRRWLDLDEPLLHNKTVFALSLLGTNRLQELKDLSSKLNSMLG